MVSTMRPAPTPTETADENASKFVAAIRAIVNEAVEAAEEDLCNRYGSH